MVMWKIMGQVSIQILTDQLTTQTNVMVGLALSVDVKWLLQSAILLIATTLFFNVIIVNPHNMKQHVNIQR